MKATKRQPWPKVRLAAHKNGTTAWLVDARINGKGQRLFFSTKEEADTKADLMRTERKNKGTDAVLMPEKLRQEALEAAGMLEGFGVSLLDAVRHYIKHAKPDGGARTVRQLLEEFLETKKASKRRAEYLRVQAAVLGKFAASFGDRGAHEITSSELKEWLKNPEWQPRTQLNYFRDLRNLFGFAVKQKYVASNPLLSLEAPEIDETVPGILTPDQAAALLTAAEANGKILPFVALGLFGGLRTAELLRLDWRNIDFEDRDITIDAAASKTRQVRYVPMAENLVAWLLPYRRASGPIRPPAWRWHFEAARKAAGITPWVDNSMRHSFGSYHFALHNDAPRTAAALGHHSSTATLFKHYRKLAKKKHAEAYFSLSPSPDAERKIVRLAA